MRKIHTFLIALLLFLSIDTFAGITWDAPIEYVETNYEMYFKDTAFHISEAPKSRCEYKKGKLKPFIVLEVSVFPKDIPIKGILTCEDAEFQEPYIDESNNRVIFLLSDCEEGVVLKSITLNAKGYGHKKRRIEKAGGWQAGEIYRTNIQLVREDAAAFRIKTTPPFCEVKYNGEVKGTTNEDGLLLIPAVNFKNFHSIEISKKGYLPETGQYTEDLLRKREDKDKNYVFTTADTLDFSFQLSSSGRYIVNAPKGVTLTIQDIKGEKVDTLTHNSPGLPFPAYAPDGTYIIIASRKGFQDSKVSFTIKDGNSDGDVVIPALDTIMGVLSVKSKPSGAILYIDGKVRGKTPFEGSLPVGDYTYYLSKEGRPHTDVRSLTILEGKTTSRDVDIPKRQQSEWWSNSQFYPHNYLEGYYGFGVTSDMQLNNYAGLSYSYIRHALGFQLSGMYGFNNRDIVATAGPVLTMTNEDKTDLDLQLTLGAGYASILQNDGSRLGTWAVEGGLRFGFDNAIDDRKFSLWSLYVGAKYYDRKIVPTLGISLMPVGLFASDYATDEPWFSHVYFDPMVGYAVHSADVMVGGSFAWQKHNAGIYTSFMYGIFDGNISAIVGPVFRLTPKALHLDLSLYGGIGYGYTYRHEHCLAGDWGLRFAFGDDVFNWYNFALGCTTYGEEWVPTFALSLLPVKGLVELAKLTEYDFPSHYTECIGAYAFGNEEGMIGANYTWIQSHLGVYGSFLVGFDGSAAVNVGPVFRLTPDRCAVDLQLYQGVGWSMFDDSTIGGETGLRMGFRSNSKFGMYSLNVGINYSADDIALSFGMSWPILGLLSTLGVAAMFY